MILIDKLINRSAKIYYSGDFDPEGIIMADKLKQRYGENLIFWRYTKQDYLSIKSTLQLEEYRIKKMKEVDGNKVCF